MVRLDDIENTICIIDTDVTTELYTILFQNMEDINLGTINYMNEYLRQNEYHPLDRDELPVFFQRFIYQFSGESIHSDEEIPKEWKEQERLLIYRNPCYILRKN